MRTNWLKSLWSRRPRANAATSFRFRPTLETLESRETPAALAAAPTLSLGFTATSTVSADFTNDGIQDFAVGGSVSGGGYRIAVLLGNNSGSFGSPITTDLTSSPGDMAAADFNNDGRVDLVYVNGSSSVVTLLGQGDGRFASPITSTTTGLGSIDQVAAGDFNNDGKVDVVGGRFSTVQIGLGNGDGTITFGNSGIVAFGTITDVAAAYVDGDNNLDAIVTTSNGGGDGVYFFTGQGTSLLGFGSLPSTSNLNATSVAVGNFDGNSSPDFVVSFSNSAPLIFKNTGGSITLDSASLGASGANLPTSLSKIAAANLNGDVFSDIVASSGTSLYVAASQGSSGYVADPDGPYTLPSVPAGLAVGDINGDGPTDILAPSGGQDSATLFLCRFSTTTTITSSTSPTTYGQSYTVTAQVLPDVDLALASNAGGIRGNVSFYVNGLLVGSSPVSLLGQASLTIPVGTGPALPVGIDTLTATFSGNVFFKPSTSNGVGIQVNQGTAGIALSGGGTVNFGQPVTFTATVTPPLLPPNVVGPTGTVTFTNGTTVLGTSPLVQAGTGAGSTYTASFTSSTLAPASYSVTATYNGDTNWNASGPSNAVPATVNAAVAGVQLQTSTPGPISQGQSITLTATVTGNSVTPTGTVQFLSGIQVLGTRTLSAGSATLATTALPAGANALTVAYLGDSVYSAATSSAVTIQVQAPNQVYVANAYQLLLGRAPDPGAQVWVDMLNAGTPPQSVIFSLAMSPEYLNRVVAGLYQKYLGRAPDPGAQVWVQSLQQGGTIESVTAGIVSSPEFSNKYSSNAAYVTALYQLILGRDPSQTEVNQWVAAFARGTSLLSVATVFVTSTEYRQNLVQSYYQTYLGRAADPAGLSGWVGALASGQTDQQVIAQILGSPEGYAKWSA